MVKLHPPEGVNLHGADTGDRECLSHTRLGVLLACQQKYHWAYERNLEPAVKKASLSMGGAFAYALERGNPLDGRDRLLEEHDALIEEARGNPWISTPTRDEAETDATIVYAASTAYLRHYGKQDAGDVQREVVMRARVRNPATGHYSRTFDVQARIDGLNGDRLIEDKLVGRVDQITERRLLLDRQVTLGCYLHWRTTGEEITEISYRMTKRPSIKQRQDESVEQYRARIVADYLDVRPEFYLHEFTLTRTPEDFLRLEQELWSWAEQVRAARRDGVFPRNTAACMDFGGCPFLALCCREPGAEHQFVERQRPSVEISDGLEVAA